jgi:hypothetical protein
MPAPASNSRRWNYPFLLLLLLESAVLVGMAWFHRVPREHDGFGYFGLQYYFLNNAAVAGELPQWIPYMTQGTVANWWYAVQGGIFANSVALLAGPIGMLKGLNYLPFFYAGIFFDGLILLVGTWLLAHRLFRSTPTSFFVCLIVVGPCIWMDQPWYNFHFFYALPLVLALVHRFLDRGSWLSLSLAMNLFALQTLGNLPYLIPVSSLVIALYFGLFTLFDWQPQLTAVRRLRFGLPAALTLLVGLGSLAAAFLILRLGTSEIANYNTGRGLDARVSLDTFLTYGGEITRRKWAEPFLGVSPSLDNTLYMGLLSLPLMGAGCIFSLRRRYAHVHLLCGVLLLLGLGGFVATQAYRWWPFMKYYRHIGLTGSVTRLFLCFLAGAGFEAVFLGRQTKPHLRVATALLATGLLVLSAGLFYLVAEPAVAQRILKAMHTHAATSLYVASPPTFHVIFETSLLRSRLAASGCIALLGGVLLAGRALLLRDGVRKILIAVALALVALDVYAYKCGEARLRTISLPSRDMDLLTFQEMPYRARRSLSFFAPNPRVEALQRDFAFPGIRHWSTSPFAFVDEAGSSFRVDHWLLPLDRFLRACRGQDINDRNVPLVGFRSGDKLEFPQQEAALKLAGVTADKIQFFRRGHLLNNDTEVAAQMSRPHYRGNVLFVSGGDKPPSSTNQSTCSSPFDTPSGHSETSYLSADDRVEVEYRVERFDSNNLELAVRNTTGAPVWLLFSDVWHPGWSAQVNGREVPVYRGALAYKAIQLPAESSRVHFRFAIGGVSSLYVFFGLCSTLWLGILTALATGACRSAADNLGDVADPNDLCKPPVSRLAWVRLAVGPPTTRSEVPAMISPRFPLPQGGPHDA